MIAEILLAQLVAPPTQQGPIRLPGTGAKEQPSLRENTPAPVQVIPTPEPTPDAPADKPPAPESSRAPTKSGANFPYPISGTVLPYDTALLQALFQGCATLEVCADRLRRQLASDGYLNSQVLITASPPSLQVRLGRLEAIRVDGASPWLNRRVQRLTRGLTNQPLRLSLIEQQLRLLQSQPGIKTVKATLTSINSDPRRAQLSLTVEPGPQPIRGEVTLRNDGNDGSGEYRASGVLLKNALALPGDTLLFYGELDGTDTPELGTVIGSVSYTLPLADTVGFTGSFGYNRRTPVELEKPFSLLTTDQYQGQLQLEWTFHETLLQRWSVTASISSNENQLSFDGDPLPSSFPSLLRNPRTGFLRLGLNGNGLTGPLGWSGTAYLLQGLSGMTPSEQLGDLGRIGKVPGEATAIGGLASASWFFAPSWQLNLRAGGQVAFQPLTSPMQFSIGSDVGIRGLPGQLISGDSGWLSTGEVVWTFWRNKAQALQLVPFIGAGGVTTDTNLDGTTVSDVVGSGGLLARWLAGDNLSLELGYAQSFNTDNNPGAWDDWLLGSGLYAKASFRF